MVGSLQNIHQNNNNNEQMMMYPQVDHWMQLQQRQSAPIAPHDHVYPLKKLRAVKSKSMPQQRKSQRTVHMPTQQSVEMNPYLDQQIMFDPQHNNAKRQSMSKKKRSSKVVPTIGKVKFAPRISISNGDNDVHKKRRKSKGRKSSLKMSGFMVTDSMYQ